MKLMKLNRSIEWLWRCSKCREIEWASFALPKCNHCGGKIESLPLKSRKKSKKSKKSCFFP
tara:strand:+ start:230 stop:412 length:183 start_codon:yes stop_codon:yes gene_type:complete